MSQIMLWLRVFLGKCMRKSWIESTNCEWSSLPKHKKRLRSSDSAVHAITCFRVLYGPLSGGQCSGVGVPSSSGVFRIYAFLGTAGQYSGIAMFSIKTVSRCEQAGFRSKMGRLGR